MHLRTECLIFNFKVLAESLYKTRSYPPPMNPQLRLVGMAFCWWYFEGVKELGLCA